MLSPLVVVVVDERLLKALFPLRSQPFFFVVVLNQVQVVALKSVILVGQGPYSTVVVKQVWPVVRQAEDSTHELSLHCPNILDAVGSPLQKPV